ncbi:Chaperone protein DnaK [compost metagenome]
MVKDAEAHAEEDRARKELVEARNEADQLVYSVDKTIKDLGDKVDQGEIDKANAAKEKVTTALAGNDLETIKAATAELTEVIQQLSVKLYEQASQQQGPDANAGAGEAPKGRENVVDADYEVVDEPKK